MNSFAFLSSSKVADPRVTELENQLKKNEENYAKMLEEKLKVEEDWKAEKQERAKTDAQKMALLEENERFRIRLEEKNKQVSKFEGQLRFMKEGLNDDDRDMLEHSLRLLAE